MWQWGCLGCARSLKEGCSSASLPQKGALIAWAESRALVQAGCPGAPRAIPQAQPGLPLLARELPGPDLRQETWQRNRSRPWGWLQPGDKGKALKSLRGSELPPGSETVSAQVEVPGPKAGKDLELPCKSLRDPFPVLNRDAVFAQQQSCQQHP